jgi:predicted porin
MMFWDDGVESDVYFVDSAVSGSRLILSGTGDMGGGFTAGYYARIMMVGDSSNDVDQNNDDAGAGLSMSKSFLYITHRELGTLSTGMAASAADDIANINLNGAGVVASADSIGAWNGSMFIRRTNENQADVDGNMTWSNAVASDLGGGTGSAVRYDTPTLLGMTGSVSYAEDDQFDVALRYANEFRGEFRVAAGIGYWMVSDFSDANNGDEANNEDTDREGWGGSIAMMHVPTGLNIAFNYAKEEEEAELAANAANEDETTIMYVTGGISQKFFSPGKTSIYGEYHKTTRETGDAEFDVANDAANDADELETVVYGFGIVQAIDSAAMEMYMAYRTYQLDGFSNNGATVADTFEDYSTVMMGARIKF